MPGRWRLLTAAVATVFAGYAASVLIYKNLAARKNELAAVEHAKPYPAGADAGYVDSATCAGCHRAIWDTYRRTGMGRSFQQVRPGSKVAFAGSFYHQASDRYYSVFERDGRFIERRNQTGFDGRETNVVEEPIDFVVGSGNHARTYLHRSADGRIFELPLAWYAENGGSWAMNPGYDRPNHDDFRRQISYECIFCHTGYPDVGAGMDASGGDAVFPGRIPDGIDCQRCHGPGRKHIEAAAGKDVQAIRAAIANPLRFSPERQLEVCMQCHLETTSRRLPHAIVRYGRGIFSYRPGEPLADYVIHFDHDPGTGYDDKFEIAHQAYRLRKSKCFLRSAGQLTCTTCHNPHNAKRGAEATEHYAAVCRTCHGEVFSALIQRGRHPSDRDCVTCHMPKRRTDDVVHVVMTDHYIQRRKPAGDLSAMLPERRDTQETMYHGRVRPYYPETAPELYVAVAQVKQLANVKEGIPELRRVLERQSPPSAEPYLALAEAYLANGTVSEAIPYYRAALERKRDFRPAIVGLAKALVKAGQFSEAERLLASQREDATCLNNLGLIYVTQGRFADAITAFREAAHRSPDEPEIYNNLGGALSRTGDIAGAEEAYRNAIRIQPDFAAAQTSLATLLASRGDLAQAQFHYRKAMFYEPRSASAPYEYGMALARAERFADALKEFEAAIQIDPYHAEAHSSAADMLALQGRVPAAIAHYEKALQLNSNLASAHLGLGSALAAQGNRAALAHLHTAAADPSTREQAERMLQQLTSANVPSH